MLKKSIFSIFLCSYLLNGVSAYSESTVLEVGSDSRLIIRSEKSSQKIEETDPLEQNPHPLPEGPWGVLDSYPIYLQNPDVDSHYVDFLPNETKWIFPGKSREDAIRQLVKAGIPDALLRNNSESLISPSQVVIYPTDHLIQSLSSATRLNIREILKAYPQNQWHTTPRIIFGDPVAWCIRAGLQTETARIFASVCYKKKELTLFSDPFYVLSNISDMEEKVRLMKALTRVRSLILRLQITDSTDLNILRNYWSINNRRKEILPLLECIAETPRTEKIDIVHLLPPYARQRLYSYPLSDQTENCFESCLKFIGVPAGPMETTSKAYLELYREKLTPAPEGALQFGDIIVCSYKETGEPVHGAVYIAADIVFTKNGGSPRIPWILMRWNDMFRIYDHDSPLICKVYRSTE